MEFLFIILVYHHVYISYMTLNVRNSSKSLKIIIFAIFCVKFAIGSRRLPTPKKFSLPVSQPPLVKYPIVSHLITDHNDSNNFAFNMLNSPSVMIMVGIKTSSIESFIRNQEHELEQHELITRASPQECLIRSHSLEIYHKRLIRIDLYHCMNIS